MKNIITKVLVLCALILSGRFALAQNHPNNIEIMDFEIAQPGKKAIQMNSSREDLVKAFGQPLKVEDYYFEMDEQTGTVVKYKGANFYYSKDNKLMGFDFGADGAGFLLKFKSQQSATGIGRSLNKLKKLKKVTGGAFYNIQSAGADKDESISFEIDKNGRVKRIIYGDYDANQDKNTLTLDDLRKPFDL